MTTPKTMPNGRLDRIRAGSRNITIQTEFFATPSWRLEIKVYVDGALKKMEKVPLEGIPEESIQALLDQRHEEMAEGLASRLRSQAEARDGTAGS